MTWLGSLTTSLPSARVARRWLGSALVFLASGVAAVAASYLIAGRSSAFLLVATSSTILFFLPDAVLAWGILTLGPYGMSLLTITATIGSVGLFAGLAAASVRVADATNRMRAEALFAVGLTQALAAFLLTIRPLVAVAAAAAGTITVAIAGGAVTEAGTPPGRRKVLRSVGSAAAAVGLGWVVVPRPDPLPEEEVTDGTVLGMLEAADGRSVELEGAEPLVSEQFYQVDINMWEPILNREEWTLSIRGDAASFGLDYGDLTSREAHHRFITLRCVSDALNGREMDTALWTGIPVEDILEEADAPEQCCVFLEADDGYTHAFPREVLRDGFLAWRMNGKLLPRAHGHPVRILIPGHWGEVSVKWITAIEIRDEPATGYWEQRGWDGDGPVETVAKLHSVETDGGSVRIGGHAFAGGRGVERVEVSTDGGDSWQNARLTEPLPAGVPRGADSGAIDGEATHAWRQWHYEYDADREHEVVVRAVEPDGTVQPETRRDPYPDGSSGWVRREIDPTD